MACVFLGARLFRPLGSIRLAATAISPVGLNTPRGYGYFARWAQYASRLRLFRPLGSIRLAAAAISPVGLNTPRGCGYFARWAQYASAVCPTPCPRPTGRGWAQTAPRRRRIQTPRGGIHQTAPRRRRIQTPRDTCKSLRDTCKSPRDAGK